MKGKVVNVSNLLTSKLESKGYERMVFMHVCRPLVDVKWIWKMIGVMWVLHGVFGYLSMVDRNGHSCKLALLLKIIKGGFLAQRFFWPLVDKKRI